MNHNRNVVGFGAVAAVLLAGAAGAAFAHPHPEGEGDGKKVERVIVIRDGAKGGHHSGDGRVRRFKMHGGDLAGCEGGEKIVDESGGDGDKKTKVIVCTRGAPTAATAKHLEDALARINANDQLSDEQKAKIATALRSAIDRARSAR